MNFLSDVYGATEGPLGFPLNDRQAFALESALKALPKEQPSPNNPRITCELIAFHLEAPRYFPNVGQAQLSKAHFKCTVISDQGKEVRVYIDKDQLIPSKSELWTR